MPDLMALYLAHPFWAWIVVAGVLLAVEVMTGSGWMLWPAGVAVIVALLATFGGLDPGQTVLVFGAFDHLLGCPAGEALPPPKSLLRRADNDIIDAVRAPGGPPGARGDGFPRPQRLGVRRRQGMGRRGR